MHAYKLPKCCLCQNDARGWYVVHAGWTGSCKHVRSPASQRTEIVGRGVTKCEAIRMALETLKGQKRPPLPEKDEHEHATDTHGRGDAGGD